MAAISSIIAGTAMAGGLAQTISGLSDKAKAKKALDSLEAPELDNAFKDIQISTVGSDIMREENARTTSNLIDSAQSGGVRSVMGAVPKIQAFNNNANQETRKYIDDQVINRDYSIANQEGNIQRIEENRYQGELQGLGQMYNVANQQMWSGIQGMSSSMMYGARNGIFEKGVNDTSDPFNGAPTVTETTTGENGGFESVTYRK